MSLDVPMLLSRLQGMSFLFKKVTPRELTSLGLQRALDILDVKIDTKKFATMFEAMRNSGRSNMYELLSDPKFQEELQTLIQDKEHDDFHVPDCRVFARCPKCNHTFLANPQQFEASRKDKGNAEQQAAEPDRHRCG